MTDPTAPHPDALPALLSREDVAGIAVVGVGSLYAIERAGQSVPGGVAASVPTSAAALGARGIAVSRVGMDRVGRDVTDAVRVAGANVDAIQTDPDLVTPRWIERGTSVRIEPYGAFDTIQWDADVEALARSAEVIVTDALGRRHGQSRSTIDRMLIAATTAVRVIDLTRRAPSDPPRLDREAVGQTMELCDLFVGDALALRALVPSATDGYDAARRLFDLRRRGAVVLVATGRDEGCVVTARGSERTAPIARPDGTATINGSTIALAAALATVLGRPPHEVLQRWT